MVSIALELAEPREWERAFLISLWEVPQNC